MQSLISKTRRYVEQYVTNDKLLRSLIIPALLALVAYNFFEIKTYQSMAQLTSKEAKESERINMAAYFCMYCVVGYSTMLLYEIFNAYFVAIAVKSSIINFFTEFLNVNYKAFMQTGLGEAQYCINRRVYSLIEFLSSICIDFVSNLLFFLIAVSSLSKEIKNFKLKAVILACIIGFIGISCFLQYLRSIVRFKVNEGFEKSSRKMYDILYNYERIISYDNLEYELDKYRDSMDDQVFYSIIFWVSFELISFLNVIFFLVINIYCLSVLGISKAEILDLKSFTLVFYKMKEKVINMIESVDSLANNFVNLDQNVIKDCKDDERDSFIEVNISGSMIEIINLYFKYDNQMIISNLSAKINEGEKVAIAGPNGSGKSTLIKVLEGFYDYEGTVKIDGFDLGDISKKRLRQSLAYIPQNSYLFDSTIIENLKQGNILVSDEKVVEYAKLYRMHEIFKELGYNKRVGEKGNRLSGGQRQKVCFLRAVIKDAPVMLFDEATSNMDQNSELKIIEDMKTYMMNKTIIMIVHNLELLKHFDKVIYLGGKECYEEGSFEDLMSKKGNFYNFYESSVRK